MNELHPSYSALCHTDAAQTIPREPARAGGSSMSHAIVGVLNVALTTTFAPIPGHSP